MSSNSAYTDYIIWKRKVTSKTSECIREANGPRKKHCANVHKNNTKLVYDFNSKGKSTELTILLSGPYDNLLNV